MKPSLPIILIVDDQPENLKVLEGILSSENYDLRLCLDGKSALELAGRVEPDLILLDVIMPELDGFEVCGRLKSSAATKDIPVIFITASNENEDVVNAFQVGGVDYITKPFRESELKLRVATQVKLRSLVKELKDRNAALEQEIAQRRQLKKERDHLTNRLSLISDEEAKRWGIDGFVGRSKTLQGILGDIERLQQNADTSVIITGESGTGKELIARAIHFGSSRAESPFVPVNCSALPRELADSLFFGHVKGAFTGALQNREGYFQLADGGTLFLDEVGDMPLELQAKLLRVLEDRKVMPLGAKGEQSVDVRICAATNAKLERAIEEGKFREDLYYRLAGFSVTAAPLRDRREDIPLLVRHFMDLFTREMVHCSSTISDAALDALSNYSFPGNIRELKNIVERALIECDGQAVEVSHLFLRSAAKPAPVPKENVAASLPLNLKEAELALIKRALAETNGNIVEAARRLGVHRTKIYRRLAEDSEAQFQNLESPS